MRISWAATIFRLGMAIVWGYESRPKLGIESAAALEQVKVRASENKSNFAGVSKPGSTPRSAGFLLSKAVGSVVSGARFTYERFSVSMNLTKLVLQTFPIWKPPKPQVLTEGQCLPSTVSWSARASASSST